MVNFVYKPLLIDGNGDPILDGEGKKQYVVANYPDGSSVQLIIELDADGDEEIVLEATIVDSVATVHGDYVPLRSVKTGRLWRSVITYADTINKTMCNGIVVRYDGKPR